MTERSTPPPHPSHVGRRVGDNERRTKTDRETGTETEAENNLYETKNMIRL